MIVFKLIVQKNGSKKSAEFYILGQRFLQLNYEFNESSTKLTITYSGYQGKYIRKHATWSFDSSYDTFTNTIIVTKGTFNPVKYLNRMGQQLSQNEYLGNFDSLVTSSTLTRIRRILDYHNYYFPTTKAVQSGSANEHLKEELRLTFNRLQNNTELNLVKKQIQDYIEAAENGLLIDKRPKE